MCLLSGTHLCISNKERLTSPIQDLSDLSFGKNEVKLVEFISLSLPSMNLSITDIQSMATLSTLSVN